MVAPKNVSSFLTRIKEIRRKSKKSSNSFFEQVESDIDSKAKFMEEQISREKQMHDHFNSLVEYKKVLRIASELVRGAGAIRQDLRANNSINAEAVDTNYFDEGSKEDVIADSHDDIGINNMCGTILSSEKERLSRLVFRATRGNVLVYFRDFKNPIMDYYGNEMRKSVYVMIYPDGETIQEKLIKICDSFMGERYEIPPGGIEQKIEEINEKIKETKRLIYITQEEIEKYLYSINTLEGTDLSAILLYKWFITKETSLYKALN